MVRTPCCSKTGLKRGPWTSEEDDLLVHYISSHGEGGWRTLPKKAGLRRCGKSCRLRWMNYLRPDVKRGQITPDEEDIILRMHRLLGNRWSLIAGRIPGRTDNEIKNYWNTHLSKKLITQGIDPRTHKPLSNTSKITTKEKQDLQSHDGDAHKGHEVLMVFDSQDSHEKSHSGSDDEDDDDDDEEDDHHESLKNGGMGSSQSVNPETNITKNGGVAITGDIHGYNNMEENLVGDTANNELEEAYHSDIMSFFLECFMDEPEDNVERSRQHQNMLGLQQHGHTSQISKSDYDAMWSSKPPESPTHV